MQLHNAQLKIANCPVKIQYHNVLSEYKSKMYCLILAAQYFVHGDWRGGVAGNRLPSPEDSRKSGLFPHFFRNICYDFQTQTEKMCVNWKRSRCGKL